MAENNQDTIAVRQVNFKLSVGQDRSEKSTAPAVEETVAACFEKMELDRDREEQR